MEKRGRERRKAVFLRLVFRSESVEVSPLGSNSSNLTNPRCWPRRAIPEDNTSFAADDSGVVVVALEEGEEDLILISGEAVVDPPLVVETEEGSRSPPPALLLSPSTLDDSMTL